MDSKAAFRITQERLIDAYIGVPDSLLNPFISAIEYSGADHVIVVNEAHAVGVAFGMALGGRNPCVYLQNSGIGNILNPLTSLCIPSKIEPLIVIGHRHTLSQHKIMGEVDSTIMAIIGYTNYIIVTEK